MVTTWPPNFPGQGTGANKLARYIGELSGGRLTVDVKCVTRLRLHAEGLFIGLDARLEL